MADVLGAVRKIVPWIGAAAATALPGPLGAAALAIGKALGTPESPAKIEPTVEAVQDAVMNALGDPAKIAALRAQDNQFKLDWQKAGFQHETDIDELGNKDRADARAREIAVRDHTPQIGFYLLTSCFFGLVFVLCKWAPPSTNEKLLYLLLGSIGTSWTAAMNYFYGSTSGSARKTELLAQAPGIDAKA